MAWAGPRPPKNTPCAANTLRSRLLRHLHPVNLQSALTQARFVDWQRVADGERVVEQRASAKSSGAFSTSTVSPVNIRPKANRREHRCVWRKGQGATYEYGSSLQIFFSRMAKLPLAKAYGDRTDWACEVQFSSRRENLSWKLPSKCAGNGATVALATSPRRGRVSAEAGRGLTVTYTSSKAGNVLKIAAVRS